MGNLNLEPDKSRSCGRADMLRDASMPLSRARRYSGQRSKDGICEVWVEESAVRIIGDAAVNEASRRKLPLHLEIRNHSPTGFEWGYQGSGPAQLALALLVDLLGDTALAQSRYQDFKRQIVAKFSDSWTLTADEIREFLAKQPNEQAS